MIFRIHEYIQFAYGNERVGFSPIYGRVSEIRKDTYLIVDKYGGRWDIQKDNNSLKIVGF